jgi:hypothetical protein
VREHVWGRDYVRDVPRGDVLDCKTERAGERMAEAPRRSIRKLDFYCADPRGRVAFPSLDLFNLPRFTAAAFFLDAGLRRRIVVIDGHAVAASWCCSSVCRSLNLISEHSERICRRASAANTSRKSSSRRIVRRRSSSGLYRIGIL